MLGPSGFFLPAEADSMMQETNDIELLHTSEEGFNELYRVCKNGRFFVYKALKEEYRGNILYEQLLSKDFGIGFSLSHSGICQYFAKIKHPVLGNCIIMEWIDGCTLEELIAKGKADSRLSRKIICEICEALDYMHRKQVIHRDLKPENILITHNGQNVKLIDFGLSDADSYSILKAPAGTRIYASPELVAGEQVDLRSDIWSLGIIINELSRRYRHIAATCLRRDRDRRYGSALEVRDAVLKESSRKLRNAVIWISAVIATAAISAIIYMRETSVESQASEVPQTEQTAPTVPQSAAADTVMVQVMPQSKKQAAQPIETGASQSIETETEEIEESDEDINVDELDKLFDNAAQSILQATPH